MDQEQRKQWPALAVAVLLGSGSGMGGTAIYIRSLAPQDLQEIARPDPATGTELEAVRRQVQHHLTNHPDQLNRFDRRISRLEAQIEILLERQRASQ